MNYHVKERSMTERAIIDALYDLMEEKELSDISITELIEKAGVARTTYYRNYESKVDVLRKSIRIHLENFAKEYPAQSINDLYSPEYIENIMLYASRYKRMFLILEKSGTAYLYLSELNNYLVNESGWELTPEQKIRMYSYAGAEFNLIFNCLFKSEIDEKITIDQIKTLGIKLE